MTWVNNIVTILPLKVLLLLTLFCLGTVAHHLKLNQICNILYLLIHQEPVAAFEEGKNMKFAPNSTQFILSFSFLRLALCTLLLNLLNDLDFILIRICF